MSAHDHDHDEPHDRGLLYDLGVLRERAAALPLVDRHLTRRRALGMLGGGALAAVALAACDPAVGTVSGGGCSVVPEETAGPYPGDGSNGPNVLTTSGVVRSDIRSSFGTMSGTAAGIPLTLRFIVRDVSASCSNLVGAAVYAWHCTREGGYSLYSSGITNQNYLRGVQATDASGVATFTTIFPGCYSGRWPHVHFEVYPSLTAATSVSNKVATSQLALPEATCREVYATSGYSASVTNLNSITLAKDNVFSDGVTFETPTVTGNVTDGYVATIAVGVP